MPVFKNKTQGQYVNVYKDILKNHSLSLRDRGMVVTLLSLPDNWEFTISGLSKIIPDGKSSIRASLSHLEELGYISRTQERAERGKFGKIAIEIHETPVAPLSDFRQTENPIADNPSAGKPSTENRTQYINNQLIIIILYYFVYIHQSFLQAIQMLVLHQYAFFVRLTYIILIDRFRHQWYMVILY